MHAGSVAIKRGGLGAGAAGGYAGGMTRIVTPRLTLRRARPEDLGALHGVLSDGAAMRYWSTPPHESLEQTRDWLAAMIDAGDDSEDFVVERDGVVIGKAGCWRLPEIGYILHPGHWRQGLAREALGAVIAHVFARHGVPQIVADIDPRNLASAALLAQLGFVETGRAAHTFCVAGEWSDSIYLALPRPGGAVGPWAGHEGAVPGPGTAG